MKRTVIGTLKSELRTFTYKQQEITILYLFFLDAETTEQYTNTELDEINIANVHRAYHFLNSLRDSNPYSEINGTPKRNLFRSSVWNECCDKAIELSKTIPA